MTRRRSIIALASVALVWPLPSGAENHVITVTDAGFVPADTIIEIGDTVTFQKAATALAHNVVSQAARGKVRAATPPPAPSRSPWTSGLKSPPTPSTARCTAVP
jgi:plastocyanin